MKKFLILKIYILLAIFIASCAGTKIKREGDQFLWEVNSDKATVYLLGTIHAADSSLYPMSKEIMNAFEKSDYLVLEADVTKADPMALVQTMTYQDGTTLKDKLSEETYAKLKKFFEDHDVPEMFFQKMKPWGAVIFLMTLEMQQEGISEEYGIDRHFQTKNVDKKVLELESVEEQIEILQSFDEVGDDYIEYTIETMGESTGQMKEMIGYWRAGNDEALLELINEPVEEYPGYAKFLDKMLRQRNERMAEKIKGYLASGGTYFVTVGAGHLIGEDSIIRILADTGDYEIVRK